MVEEGALRPSRDHLPLDATHAIRVVPSDRGRRAEAVTWVDGSWSPSVVGDGAGLSVLHRLRSRMAVEEGFRVTGVSFVPVADESERAMGVDQTHASWVVGDAVVVKWMTEPLAGPHPAADRLRRLSDAGFAESPTLVGIIEWQEPDSGHWVPLVVVQAYLPGTEDGWTWALLEARRALGLEPGTAREIGTPLGDVVGRMHLALADEPVATLTPDLARRQAEEAHEALDLTVRLVEAHDPGSHALLVEHRDRIEAVLGPPRRCGRHCGPAAARRPPRRPGPPRRRRSLRGRRLRRQPHAAGRPPRRAGTGGPGRRRPCWSRWRTSSTSSVATTPR